MTIEYIELLSNSFSPLHHCAAEETSHLQEELLAESLRKPAVACRKNDLMSE